jgi:hypothetical protein
MAANTSPIWTLAGDLQWGTVLAANTALDGTGTTVLIHTSPSEGSRIERFRIKHLGTNVASVLRLFFNNGSTPATAANNSLFTELTLAANTISQTAQSAELEILGPWVLPTGYRVYASVGTVLAAGVTVTAIAGKY